MPKKLKFELIDRPIQIGFILKCSRFDIFTFNIMESSKIQVWNANTDRRLNGISGQAFPNYRPGERILGIVEKITNDLKKNGGICILFELEEDICEKIIELLGSDYYTTMVPYNTSKGCFNFLFVSTNTEHFKHIIPLPLTKSGQPIKNDTRPPAPKPGEPLTEEQKIYKIETLGDNFEKMIVLIKLNIHGEEVHVYVTHMGLSNDTRIQQTQKLKEYVMKYSIADNKKWVLCGDFNSFDGSVSYPKLFTEQIEILNNLNGKWLTENVQTTFSAFPYDIVFKLSKQEKDKYFELCKFSTEMETKYKIFRADELIEKLTSEENEMYFKYVEEFRTFCIEMSTKYGINGGALDHVFTNVEGVDVDIQDPGTLSDHSKVTIIFNAEETM